MQHIHGVVSAMEHVYRSRKQCGKLSDGCWSSECAEVIQIIQKLYFTTRGTVAARPNQSHDVRVTQTKLVGKLSDRNSSSVSSSYLLATFSFTSSCRLFHERWFLYPATLVKNKKVPDMPCFLKIGNAYVYWLHQSVSNESAIDLPRNDDGSTVTTLFSIAHDNSHPRTRDHKNTHSPVR